MRGVAYRGSLSGRVGHQAFIRSPGTNASIWQPQPLAYFQTGFSSQLQLRCSLARAKAARLCLCVPLKETLPRLCRHETRDSHGEALGGLVR